jgi:Flp pilus assembly protein TadB
VVWFVAVLLTCAVLALAAAAWIRRDRARAKRKAIEEDQAARLTDLKRRAAALEAREHAIENAQLAVLQSFRREHGL